MEVRDYFIPGPLSPYSLAGDTHQIHHNKIKVRRTYGWLCPLEGYKSNKWYNVQRHIDSVHGKGTVESVDSRTGETREQKIMNAIRQRDMLQTSSDHIGPHSRPISPTQQFGDTSLPPTGESSFRMPFLEQQEKRVRELGYGVPTSSQKYCGTSINQQGIFGGYDIYESNLMNTLDISQGKRVTPLDYQTACMVAMRELLNLFRQK
jgi:hypothetical protein